MNTSSKTKNIQEKFRELLKPDDHQEKIELDALMLAAPYLEIILDKMEETGMKKKDLAKELGTSASYITQLMNTNKMLNFPILARIAEVLDLKFQVEKKSESPDVDYLERVFKSQNLIDNPFVKNRFMSIWTSSDIKTEESSYFVQEPENLVS